MLPTPLSWSSRLRLIVGLAVHDIHAPLDSTISVMPALELSVLVLVMV